MLGLLLLGLLSVATALPSALRKRDYPAPGACSGDCQGDLHDPAVVYNGQGTYYRFVTHGNIQIATAPSISGPWSTQGAALPEGSMIHAVDNQGPDNIWCPDVFSYNGQYYMYYAVSAIGDKQSEIGVATSPSMDAGTWTDHGATGIPFADPYNKIDPNLFYSGSEPFLLSFGSYWQGIFQVEMEDPPLKAKAGSQPIQLAQNQTNRGDNLPGDPTEGSYQFQWSVDGTPYYYLFYSRGTVPDGNNNIPAGEEYHVEVCRSESSTGPFYDSAGRNCADANGGGDTILASSYANDCYAPGGQGVFYDPQLNSPVIVYHYSKPSVGYQSGQFQFGWNKLDFSGGWPSVIS